MCNMLKKQHLLLFSQSHKNLNQILGKTKICTIFQKIIQYEIYYVKITPLLYITTKTKAKINTKTKTKTEKKIEFKCTTWKKINFIFVFSIPQKFKLNTQRNLYCF